MVVALLCYMLPRFRLASLSLIRSLDIFAYSFAVRLQIQLVVNETAARAEVNGHSVAVTVVQFFTLLMQKLTTTGAKEEMFA